MNPNPLLQAIESLTGQASSHAAQYELGPGLLYVLEQKSRACLYIGKDKEQGFPDSFFRLLDESERWDELVPENERAEFALAWKEHETEGQSYHLQIDKRGKTLLVQDYRVPLLNAAGEVVGVCGRVIDNSFQSLAIDALMKRSWKEVATLMTRRLLHDFNNTIAGIYSLSELYAEPGSDSKSMMEAMVHIRNSSIRAQEITKRIRSLTTLEKGEASFYDATKLMREQLEYLQTLLPKGAEIAIDSQEKDLPVKVDANSFREVMLHLASNSLDAAGESVRLNIRLSLEDLKEEAIAYVLIDFEDNGHGFTPETLENAFIPFQGSKDPQKHPGLGLNIARDFARKHGGNIELSNVPDGARARLRLPLVRFGSSQASDKATSEASSAKAKPAAKAKKEAKQDFDVIIYTWEDIARHPLLLKMKTAGWQTQVHLDPGQLLLDLFHRNKELDGIIIFKSALDEKVEPLISELERARDCPPIALIALGESVETLSQSVKRICGFTAPGSSKPAGLLSKLSAFFQ